MENDLLPQKQHGFMKQLSTLTQLICHLDNVISLLGNHASVDVIYLDFAKGFDKLDIGLLLQRLEDIGIQGRVQQWFSAFLRGRKQRVKVNGTLSRESEVKSGVPQGTILGPLLFILCIAPLSALPLNSSIISYADDTKLTIGRNDLDPTSLQSDLNSIYSWVSDHNMAFNGSKFKWIVYGEPTSQPLYCDTSNQPISQVSTVRDLGVTLQCNGRYDQHIQERVSKASQMCGWMLRTFETREKTPILTLYKSLILPLLDYCCYRMTAVPQTFVVCHLFWLGISRE